MSDEFKKQKLLLSYLLGDEDVFSLCRTIIEPEFFDREIQPAVEYVINHVDKYNSIPTFDMIEAETDVHLDYVIDAHDPRRKTWACDEIEKFCRTKAVIAAVWSAADKIKNGEFDGLVDPIRDAVLLGLHRDLGTNYFENPKDRLKKMLLNTTYPIGFSKMDDILFGGVDVGGVNLVLAGSGVGKSFFLSNIALNFLERKKNVLYITHELSELLVCKRFDSMVSGIAGRNIFSSIDEASFIINQKSSAHGVMQVKYLPPGSTMSDVESFYREAVIQTGLRFDVLVLDYLDLLSPKAKISDMGNLWVKDKYVTEELRAFANEYSMYCFTASQMTRGAMDDENHTQSMVAGGISKINTVDNVFSLYQSAEMRERCVYLVQFLKTRSSAGVGKKVLLNFDPDTMRMFDSEDDYSSSDKKNDKPQMQRPTNKNLERLNKMLKRTGSGT